eukprot:2892470-Prymnesium_polylepis.3
MAAATASARPSRSLGVACLLGRPPFVWNSNCMATDSERDALAAPPSRRRVCWRHVRPAVLRTPRPRSLVPTVPRVPHGPTWSPMVLSGPQWSRAIPSRPGDPPRPVLGAWT